MIGEWIRDEIERERREALDSVALDDLRAMWDALPDDGSVLVDGRIFVNCDDLHAALNRRGDGEYCAV